VPKCNNQFNEISLANPVNANRRWQVRLAETEDQTSEDMRPHSSEARPSMGRYEFQLHMEEDLLHGV
jgi:hypothetical protein